MPRSIELWVRLEQLLSEHAPSLLASFRKPATEQWLEAVQERMAVRFPNEVVFAYLRHNGSDRSDLANCKLFSPQSWASLKEMVACWQVNCKVAADFRKDPAAELFYPPYDADWEPLLIRPGWFYEQWIPIGASNTPSATYIDLRPGPAGKRGQLISDDGSGNPIYVAESLDHFLEKLITGMESRTIFFQEEWRLRATGDLIYNWTELR